MNLPKHTIPRTIAKEDKKDNTVKTNSILRLKCLIYKKFIIFYLLYK